MPEENDKKPKVEQPTNPLVVVIERNGVSVTLTEARTTKGKSPGAIVFNPDFSDEAAALIWVGVEAKLVEVLKPHLGNKSTTRSNMVSLAYSRVRTLTQGWAEEAENEATDETTGQLDEAKFKNIFVTLAAQFSARGETIGELEEQYEEHQNQMIALDDTNPAHHAEIFEHMREMNKLTIAIKEKQRPRKKKKESEVAVTA